MSNEELEKEVERLRNLLNEPIRTSHDPGCDCGHMAAQDCPLHRWWFPEEERDRFKK